MRVALAGKGGVGKTTITATFARLVARRGARVVAIDADSNPNLAVALGVERERAREAPFLPHQLVSRRFDGPALTEPIETVVNRYTLAAPDGVRVALMGMPTHAGEGCLCAGHATVSAVLGDLGTLPDVVTVVDMEASPEHLSRGTTRHVDTLMLVTEPYYRSLETVRRLAQLAAELPIARLAVIANKVRSEADAAAISEFCHHHGLQMAGQVPYSDSVVNADLAGIPLLDSTLDGGVIAAIGRLADSLLD